MIDEDEVLISSLQHLEFCERQWSLIHVEREWRDNELTAEGRIMHEYVHKEGETSKSCVVVATSLALRSLEHGLYGVADLVEFRRDDNGVALPGRRGRFMPYPIEYKHGKKRPDLADEMQLTAQAMCIEEMYGVRVEYGAIFYGTPKRRVEVAVDAKLREKAIALIDRARLLIAGGARPVPNIAAHCKSCSLADICMPSQIKRDASSRYVEALVAEAVSGADV